MLYTIDELRDKPASDMSFYEFGRPGQALFVARWADEHFTSLGDFIRFCFVYSSALQAYIEGIPVDEVEKEWFVPDEESEPAAQRIAAALDPAVGDVADWLVGSGMPEVDWVKQGDHAHAHVLEGDQYPDLVAHGAAGYLHLFVADTVAL